MESGGSSGLSSKSHVHQERKVILLIQKLIVRIVEFLIYIFIVLGFGHLCLL